ncbi:MAG TPA: hypothetical protein V6D08_18555 [Candidatus Obscuribacterales bacterium]
MDQDLERVRSALMQLQQSPHRLRVFGSESHGFRLNPPLTGREVQQFEYAHDVVLPVDYRAFLIQVANGGAGPYHGLFKLGEMDDSHGHARWRENEGLIGTLSKPFPHSEPWNDLNGLPDEDGDETAWKAFDARYRSAENVNGAIPICHRGCALRQWLVVTGPEAGHVWCDDRADYKGLYPLLQHDQKRVTFLSWYRTWLDDVLRQLQAADRSHRKA